MKSSFTEHSLANGLKIVMEIMPEVTSAAAGFFASTGARDETPELAGVSHFLEHMCFKGTPRRTWRQLNIDFDDLGSQYNAYTMKDRTFYYGWVPSESIEAQIGIIADMMQSTLPADEFDMEKNVVLEEIAMAKDHIDNLAYEFMHEQVYPDHPLRWPVLGFEETIKNLTRDQMDEYFRRRYAPDNLVLIVSGAIDPSKIIATTEKLCGDWVSSPISQQRQAPQFQTGKSCKVFKRFNQQVLTYVFPTPGGVSELDETADVVASVLGGENSRFYWNIVQEGVAPHAGVWRVDYAECGLMMLSGQCEPDCCDALAEAMQEQARKISTANVLDKEVQRVKNRRRTTLALESEAPYYRLGQLLDDIDYRQRPRTVQERLADVDAITPQSIADYLEQYPITKGGHFISVGPRDWVPAN